MSHNISRRVALKGLATIASAAVLSKDGLAETPAISSETASELRERSFDDGWRFNRGDAPGAEDPAFNDLAWRKLDLPHDWSIEDVPPLATDSQSAEWNDCTCPTEIGPFSKSRSEGKGATAWTVGGIGWYRKSFPTPQLSKGGRVSVRFDGVYMNADFWINGKQLGTHPYGYTTFEFELTPHLREQGHNVLAVKVNNSGKTSRWYSGSGIYRHVWLTVTEDVYVPLWGVHIAPAEISTAAAGMAVSVQIQNRGSEARDVDVRLRILDADGHVAGTAHTTQTVESDRIAEVKLTPVVNHPRHWSPVSPHLYRADVEILIKGRPIDKVSTPFGIRKIEVDAVHGLRINGESFKLKGGCMHHDNGVLGSAAIDRAEERRVELMKANGFNAIRCSHNPPSPAFLDACDRLGMMVMDEAFDMWKVQKNPNDYHLYFNDWWQRDLDAMVLRDRNHSSVILWSIGNEIPERADPEGVAIAKQLTDRIRQLDSTRPITAAVNALFEGALKKGGKQRPWSDTDAAFQYLDVSGYNYEFKRFDADHSRMPDRVMIETESFPLEAAAVWDTINRLPNAIGDFVWTAMDYLGESGIGTARLVAADTPPFKMPPGLELVFPAGTVFGSTSYPWFNAYCGDIDLIGNKKPQSYFRDVVWGRSKLEMAVLRPVPSGKAERPTAWGWFDELRSWTWTGNEDEALTVRIYTTGDHVKLQLNGKEVGSADVSMKTNYTVELPVHYASGELKAIALKDGKPFEEMSLKTVGAPYRVALSPDRSRINQNRNDLSYVMVHILDKDGNLVPDAVADVRFQVSGPGKLAAVGNANPRETDSFHVPRRRTYQGRCLAIVRPTGAPGLITLLAASDGLEQASVSITAQNRSVSPR
ncbi:MAG: glycoside hydrolase family 2 TIM barrel-domain containing protein [Terracidiphilus sp.]